MAKLDHTTPTPIGRRAARPAGGVLDRRGARIGAELQDAQDRGEVAERGNPDFANVRVSDNSPLTLPDIGIPRQRAAEYKALARAGESAITTAIGAKPSATKAATTTIPWDMPLGSVRAMELQGVTEDGRLVKFWDEDYPVRRVDRFIASGNHIKGGKYLLAYRGHLITTHCANGLIGDRPCISVQIMCCSGKVLYLTRKQVEPMLFGYVVPNEVQEAELLRLMQDINRSLKSRDDAPGRQRGRL